MGLLDGFTALPTQKDAAGRHVIFPLGYFGKGRTATDEDLARISAVHAVAMVTILFLPGLRLFLDVRWTVLIAPCVVGVLVYSIALHVMVRRLPVSAEKYSGLGAARQIARAYGPSTFWCLLAVSLFFLIQGLWMMSEQGYTKKNVFTVIFFGAAALLSGFLLWFLRRIDRSSDK